MMARAAVPLLVLALASGASAGQHPPAPLSLDQSPGRTDSTYGGGNFGAWFVDRFGLPAYRKSPTKVARRRRADGRRLVQRARGYRATVKRGTVTFEDGEVVGALPGKLVRGPQAAPIG